VEHLGAQYAALGIFIAAEAVLFTVPLYWAQSQMPDAITKSAWITLAGFAALTAVVFLTRKDFSFLRGILVWGGILALIAIVVGVLFGFSLGLWFSVAMVALAGAGILYDTSKILRGFPADRPVAAALELFASIMLMFWYVLRIVRSRD
ncbi:MAG: Bax inhibitor-1 family protein, partial [Planctomycetota bacterium]|nr:Bax inhibitor-1 family protein [Planctomycetota bacterium]